MLKEVGGQETQTLLAETDMLTALPPSLISDLKQLPTAITGADFIAKYGSHGDDVTTVAPECTYSVADATRHPIEEHHRVQMFAKILHLLSMEGSSFEESEVCLKCQ